MTELLSLSVAILAGLMMTRLVKNLRLPDVTAYLVAGVLIGPCVIGALQLPGIGFRSYDELKGLDSISQVALGFIAFSIGNEFRLSQLRETGRQALIIGILQAVAATLLVDAALLLFHLIAPQALSVPAAITLGAIAAATAPAATLMVVRQYKAKGKLTDLLLPIVALDDAVGLVLFAVSFGIAKALSSGTPDLISIIVNPLLEIFASLLLGAAAGAGLTQLEKLFHSNTNRLAMTIGFVFLTVALSMLRIPIGRATLGFSSLLVCMMLGSVFCNLCPLSEEIMSRADKWSAPLLVLFFVISGAELELGVFAQVSSVLIGVLYILTRSAGKYFGARGSARLVGCDRSVVDYLGITLLPQAGVALGMCVTAASLPGDGKLIRNIVLFAVLVYELVGPLLTKWALAKAGDIQPRSEEVLHRRERKLAEAAAQGKQR
ncbi:MAG: cation:proton antiporter [Oscillospiraceae bacterium]|nr:cation:proton antiporter [Oscillospiraceae bacterium]